MIEITLNTHNTTCDTYGCSNIAKFVIGEEKESPYQKTLMCEECLQGIINAAPLEMILNRPELAELSEEETEVEYVGKAQEGEEVNELPLENMSFKDVKTLAVNNGLEFKVGMSKADLIAFLEGNS